ncbi:MAG TPA: AI-2E family transporter [Gemmatimonadaceae bacterium]|nr:AI-2E family transporter [Gemmatimonadaceae bacterium]
MAMLQEVQKLLAADLPAGRTRRSSPIAVVICIVVVIATLRLGRALALPIVIAVLLTLTFRAPVRWLARHRIPARLGAALVVFGVIGLVGGATALVASPAMEWIASAPRTIQTVEAKVRRVMKPLNALEQSADRMQQAAGTPGTRPPTMVQVVSPGMVERLTTGSLTAIPATLSVVFLTYFLLANDALGRRKLAGLLPGPVELDRRERLLDQIEMAASHFLVTVSLVNLCVGVATALALALIGVPNAVLWGSIAAVLNFVPYLGATVTLTLITIAATASIDSLPHALVAPAVFLAIHLTESNVVTPFALGRHLPLNTVAIFLGLLFFGWMWGIPGAVLAVPLTVCVRLVCDYVPALGHVGELLDN